MTGMSSRPIMLTTYQSHYSLSAHWQVVGGRTALCVSGYAQAYVIGGPITLTIVQAVRK